MRFSTGFGGKLAAAALVVAGVVGGVWAQASPLRTLGTFPDTKEVSAVGTNVMFLSYAVVPPTATITFSTSKTNSGNVLLTYNATTGKDSTGNNGTIKVASTYPYWDIELKTANQGVLRLPGANSAGAALRKGPMASPTTVDTAKYGIQLGILPLGKSKAELITTVDNTWLAASRTTAIAFSQVFGVSENADTSTQMGGVLGGRIPYHATDPSIANSGFNAPCPSGTSGRSGCDGTITFIVNTGLGIDTTTHRIKQSAQGTYTDTLKFVLIASGY